MSNLEDTGTWENNVRFMLDNCPHTIRSREGGGPENLMVSLVLTFTRMQRQLADLEHQS